MNNNEDIKEFNTDKKGMKFYHKKGCLIGCLCILANVIVVAIISLIWINNLFPSPPSKEEVRSSVMRNKYLFEKAINDIKELDKYVSAIEHTKYYKPEKNPSIKGLFTCGFLNGQYVQTSISNKTLEKILLNLGVEHIFIYDNCVEFSYGGAGRNYYCGVIWSANGNPVGFQGENMTLVKNGIGWQYIEENGDNKYYTEKIFDNWYFYEMWF